MKLTLLTLLAVLSVPAQTVLICGTSRGCTFAGIGSGIAYDAQANKLVATPPATQKTLPVQVDTFTVSCSSISPATPVGCPGGIAQTIFRTARPVTTFILALRAIAQSEGPTNDYTHVTNADGTWTITFAVPMDTGNVLLIYQ